MQEIQQSIGPQIARRLAKATPPERQELIDDVARINVLRTAESILRQSSTLAKLAREGRIAIVCAMYDVTKGEVSFLDADLTRLSLVEPASVS